MAVKGQENLIPLNERTKEEQREIARQGGIASGKARQEKATMKKDLEYLMNETDSKGVRNRDKIALALMLNAMDKNKGGNVRAYEVIAKMLGELDIQEQTSTPQVNINIVDNSDLEKVLYEDENNENQ